MNILLLSYGNYEYDGRLRELCTAFSEIGNLCAFTNGLHSHFKSHIINSGTSYLSFIAKAFQIAKTVDDLDMLVLDNRKAVIPGLIIKYLCHPKVLVQDSRELYLMHETKHFVGKVGCFFERIGLKKADVIICANSFRAKYMKDYFSLPSVPIVYENLRRLEYSDDVKIDSIAEEFKDIICDGEIRIITTSGCSFSRTNNILAENLTKVNQKCRLLLVGSSSLAEIEGIQKIAKSNGAIKVSILGNQDQNHLKYLIDNSHIGIVNYNKSDTNNMYCASGKIYEFIYEGIPVVTTTNPPLKEMCDNFGIGVADDEYYKAINEVLDKYDCYKERVKSFADSHKVSDNNQQLITDIKTRLPFFQ